MAMPPHDPHAELALVARMQRGDEAAFVALYRRHRDAVYRFALLYCGSAAAAADVTQDTFVHFLSRPGQF
ncbi:MAG TPA: sigma factor, partial [Myxococcota bacterium]|nr:sigma factor [Myxococcota bacterium]